MRAHVLAAAALAALTACDTSQDVLRFNLDQDFYEAPSLGTLERAFRREAPFYVDMPDAAVLSDEARARLDLQAAWMAEHPSTRFYLVAVAQPARGGASADDPAHARARTVEAYLAAAGIDPARLRVRVVPAGFGETPFDPFLRVTTMLAEGPATRHELMAALAKDAVPAAGDVQNNGVQGAGDVGDPVGANGGPSVPVGGTDGPAAGRPSAPTAGGAPGATPSAFPSTASGATSQGPVGGGATAQGPETGGSSGPGAAPSQPSAPTSAGPGASGPSNPGPSNPEPGNSGKNAAKRDANSGRGNGDEAGDPGNSGGRNQGGDEIG